MKKLLFIFIIFSGLILSACFNTKDVDFIVEKNIDNGRLITFSYEEPDGTLYFYNLTLKKNNDNSLEIRHYSKGMKEVLEKKTVDFYDLKVGNIEKKEDRIVAVTINGIRYYNMATY